MHSLLEIFCEVRHKLQGVDVEQEEACIADGPTAREGKSDDLVDFHGQGVVNDSETTGGLL